MKILHIIASPRGDQSNSLRVSKEFLSTLIDRSDDLTVETLDLFRDDLPAVAGENIETRYGLFVGQSVDSDHEESWKHIEVLIDSFLNADLVLIAAPMWNFSIPYALKYYIDCLVQPNYTFTYSEAGQAVPLVRGKTMVVCTSRGGEYLPNGPAAGYDFQEPYLRTVFGFIGLDDIRFIHAQPMDAMPERKEKALQAALREARSVAGHVLSETALRT